MNKIKNIIKIIGVLLIFNKIQASDKPEDTPYYHRCAKKCYKDSSYPIVISKCLDRCYFYANGWRDRENTFAQDSKNSHLNLIFNALINRSKMGN